MRISVQRRLGLPLDAACQAAAAGKKTRTKKVHDEFGDAAVNVPQQSHNTRHKCVLQRLILALRLRAAWGTAVRMEPPNHLCQRVTTNTTRRGYADNIGRGGRHYCGDVKFAKNEVFSFFLGKLSNGEAVDFGGSLFSKTAPRGR